MKRTAAILLSLNLCWLTLPRTGFGATQRSPEEIWKSLEQLPSVEREKKLISKALPLALIPLEGRPDVRGSLGAVDQALHDERLRTC